MNPLKTTDGKLSRIRLFDIAVRHLNNWTSGNKRTTVFVQQRENVVLQW